MNSVAEALQQIATELRLFREAMFPEKVKEPEGPRCPNCGSPKYTTMEAMGAPTEYQCSDCDTRWAYENAPGNDKA
jgi:tRNA(Ile2) C34 agmatinyltransferase TiaS